MGALVDGQFDGNLLAPLSQTWFVVLLGLWIGAHGDGGGHPPVRMVTGRWRTSVVSALLLTQVGQLALGAPQWLDAATWRQRTPYPAAADGTQKLAPRYWVQGWF
jgi:hypothetical protein